MTREDGILKVWQSKNTAKLTFERATRLIKTEYNNYIELCEFCGEEPKNYKQWTKETIKPLKK